MTLTTSVANTLEAISPETLSQYLRARGWHEAGDFLGKASIWHLGEDLEVLLPKSDHLRDYKTRVCEIIDVLELSEHRDRQQILNDLLLQPTDLIKIRIDSPDIIGGTIPIDEAVRLYEATSKIMKFIASATVQPRSVYRGGIFAEVKEYLQELRVGETEQGSYIINVLSPIMQEHENFGRKVNLFLNRALTAINTTTKYVLAGSNIDIFEQSVESGVSSNLCDALLEVGNYTDLQDLSFRWQWSPMWDAPANAKEKLDLSKQTFPVLKEASKLLKSKDITYSRSGSAPSQKAAKTSSSSSNSSSAFGSSYNSSYSSRDSTLTIPPRSGIEAKIQSQSSDHLTAISGKVIGLTRRDDAALASVTILAKIEGSDRELQLELSESFYAKAVHAHLARRKIAFYGEIVREGEAIAVRNMQDLRVV